MRCIWRQTPLVYGTACQKIVTALYSLFHLRFFFRSASLHRFCFCIRSLREFRGKRFDSVRNPRERAKTNGGVPRLLAATGSSSCGAAGGEKNDGPRGRSHNELRSAADRSEALMNAKHAIKVYEL